MIKGREGGRKEIYGRREGEYAHSLNGNRKIAMKYPDKNTSAH